MNESGGNFAEETTGMVSDSVTSASTELRKRRSTRIVQAVPLVVTGVDALGRPFVERTSSLIINCHGCRYQSKHYVLKNMWVTMEVPHQESRQPPRTVRGRVAWIQRPRTVRQLFQVARLVADAKQQIQATAQEAASQAVSAERRLSFEQWEQKFAAGRAEIANETAHAIEKFQHAADEHSRPAHAAAAEALRTELPRWRAPQLEQLTRDLTARLSQEGAAQRNEHAQQLEGGAETLRTVCREAEETAARLKTQSEQSEAQIVTRAESATRAHEEAAKQREEAATAQLEALRAAANEIQQQVTAALSSAQSFSHGQLASELESVQARWRAAVENTLAEAQDRAAGGLNEHARGLMTQLQDEMARHATAARESAAGTITEAEQRIAALRNALQEQTQRLESALTRAGETSQRLEQHSAQLENAQQQALAGLQAQLENVLNPHREEMQRRSEAILEETNARVRTTFEEASRQAVAQFDRQVVEMVQPHLTRAEEAVHRLAGARSLLDAALTLQQDRIRNSADEAFAESLARFRENLGSVEQILQESSQTITGRNLAELEGKAGDLKHQMVEELLKSAEWYEKKAQTQIQNLTERAIEHAGNQLRETAGEISSVFASELDHTSRSFVGHAQTQMEEVVRESFERARALFAEAADTTAAAFTDEVQRTGRQELEGFNDEVRH